jgi:hypothetical protein
VQPSEVARMPMQMKYDILCLHDAQEALRRGKLPGQK